MDGIDGNLPYKIWDTVITKNTSVKTEPHKWIFANKGTPKLIISGRSTLDFFAQVRATGSVAADDIVPTAVK